MAIVGWLVWTIWAARHTAGALADDAYITLRYAQNLALGEGLVFNPGERVFGCTEPLFAISLAALHRLSGLELPAIATGAHAAGLLTCALLLLLGARRSGTVSSGIVAGSLLLAAPFLWTLQGFAWPWVASLLAAAALLAARRPALAGLLAGLAVGCRPDAALGVALLVVLSCGEDRERREDAPPPNGRAAGRPCRLAQLLVRVPWRLVAAASITVAVLVLAAWLWFGDVLPSTLAAKQAFALGRERAAERSGLGFWVAAYPTLERVFGGAWTPLALAAGALGLARLLSRTAPNPPARLLAATGVSLAVAYPLLGVPFWPWYTALPTLAVILGLAEGARLPIGRGEARARAGHRLTFLRAFAALLVTVAAVAIIATPLATALDWKRPSRPGPRVALYHEVGAWLANETPRGARVAAFEVGTLAFVSSRHVDDILGLVSPRFVPFVATGDWIGALRASDADVVVLIDGYTAATRAPWFAARYREAASFQHHADGATVYVRRDWRQLIPHRRQGLDSG